MKKLFALFCLLGVLFIGCASSGGAVNDTQVQNADPNPAVLGDLYVENNAGFTMYMPIGWNTADLGQKYLMVRGPVENGFTKNLAFADEQFSGSVSEYLDASLEMFPLVYADFVLLERGSFKTTAGMEGGYILIQGRINEIRVVQKYYVFPNKNKTAVMAVIGTVPLTGAKFDTLFDECVKTFVWTK